MAQYAYHIVPGNIHPRTWLNRNNWTRRHFLVVLLVFTLFILLGSWHRRSFGRPVIEDAKLREGKLPGPPPDWELYRKWERELPQHDLDLPYPEGRHGLYVKFSNQIQGLGWNNVLNELLFNTHCAWRAGRAYVFSEYVWKPEYYPWYTDQETGKGWTQDFPKTPLSAIIYGPTAGAPWEDGDNAPRSISEYHWPKVCPEEDIHVIWTDDAKEGYSDKNGDEIMNHWVDLIKHAPKRCVEIKAGPSGKDGFPQSFDLWLIGSYRSVSMWEDFRDGPTSRLLKASPLVNFAVERNENKFFQGGPRPPHPLIKNPYDHMLALHLRRGDYEEACKSLAQWSSTFYGWNQLPWLPDRFVQGPGSGWGTNTPENIALYHEHCFPNMSFIVDKIRTARRDYVNAGEGRSLEILYLLTNAKTEFVEEFKAAMMSEGWNVLVTTKDLMLNNEQIGVNMAIDMEIAGKAAVFIGNGWSSFTSNVMHRRLAAGKEAIAHRFW